MKSRPQKPQILDAEVVAESQLFKVERLHLKFSNQEERMYERMVGSGRGAVMVVPVLNDQLLLAKEYAAGTHNYEVGFPKGLIDAGETPAEAANRELQEEIGYAAGKLTMLKEVSLAPSYFASKMQIFIAEQLTESWLEGDEPEPIQVVSWPLANWEALLEDADFSESRSINALFLAQKYLEKK